jgi:hypothetical protein
VPDIWKKGDSKMTELHETFFDALMQQYIHQNGLLWNRVQTLYAIQTAVIVGAFAAKDLPAASTVLLVAGIFFTALQMYIMYRDIKVRDCNKTILETLGKSFSNDFVLNPEPPKFFGYPIRGDQILYFTTVLLIIADVALLFYIPGLTC